MGQKCRVQGRTPAGGMSRHIELCHNTNSTLFSIVNDMFDLFGGVRRGGESVGSLLRKLRELGTLDWEGFYETSKDDQLVIGYKIFYRSTYEHL
jgi:hypothetical protein